MPRRANPSRETGARCVRLTTVTRFFALLACAAPLAFAQLPRVGEINFYGLRKLNPERVLEAVNLHTGDRLPASKGDLEDRLEQISGVVAARVEAVCCEGSQATLFIGIQERGAGRMDVRDAPAGAAVLPDDVLARYREYLSATGRAARSGGAADPAARQLEDGFRAFDETHVALVRDVLRNSVDAEHRAAAALLMGFAPKRTEAIADLQYALQDPDESVRANAARSLKAIAVEARKELLPPPKIEPVWLVQMLDSVVLSDRLQAVQTLLVITDQVNAPVLSLLRERALPSLAGMARWKTLEYALPAYMLLGRTAGIPEQNLLDAWRKGDRETAINQAEQAASAKK
ncbi:MAG: HEAT repeat domain-containing protein [Acidobacteria bacterium]|nr:HEAT repeat domain-containing protein [Acidobacteriota bacterium]